jgi:hypothetical protein
MVQLVNIVVSRNTFGESFFTSVNAVSHAKSPCACAAAAQRASVHFSRVVEPVEYINTILYMSAYKELDDPTVSVLLRAIAEVKLRS